MTILELNFHVFTSSISSVFDFLSVFFVGPDRQTANRCNGARMGEAAAAACGVCVHEEEFDFDLSLNLLYVYEIHLPYMAV